MSKDIGLALVLFLLTVSCILVSMPVSGTSNSWIVKAPLPGNIDGLTVLDERIYGFGRNATYEYSPATDSWLSKSPLPISRSSFGTAVHQNKIYVIGGHEKTDLNVVATYSSANQVYDPITDSWENKASLPTARGQLEANVVNDKIYLIGGRTGGQYSTVGINEVYDTAADSWTTKTPIPYPVVQYASAVVDGKIYVLGGQDEFNDPMNLAFVQIYDPSTDKWSFGSPMPEVVWQAAAGATSGVLAPKRIYLVGGITEKSIIGTNLTQIYNPENDSWTVGSPMPTARFNLQVAVLNDRLYAMSGTPYFNFEGVWSNENEQYTPIGYGTPDPTSSSLPSPPTSPSSTPEVFLIAPIAVVAIGALVVSGGLLVYFKKRKIR
jgi:hypothetical protein